MSLKYGMIVIIFETINIL